MTEFDRRQFLKVVGFSAGAAAATACKDPVEKVIPYLVQPEEVIPGIPTYYASTCRECPVACGAKVKTREGRPIKVDGNPDDPISRGALCVRGQSSLQRTYDPARFRTPLKREGDRLVPTTWEEGMALLVEKLRPAAASGKAVFLGGSETGTLDRLIDQFLAAIGSPHRVRFELYAHEALRSADELVFGTDAVPHFDLAASDVVVAFGSDFTETWLNPVQNQSGFADSRRDGRGYAVWVGPRLSATGANADLWLAPKPGTEIFVALGLAHELASGAPPELRPLVAPWTPDKVASLTGVEAGKIRDVAHRIQSARAPLALPPGNELQGANATAFAAAVQLLNVASGAIGTTVKFGPDHNVGGLARFGDMKELAGKMRGGEVSVLLVHDTNPVYAIPEAFGFADAVRRVPFVVSFSSANDETTALANLVLPDNTPYESWGDAEPVRGVKRLQQPTLRPLFDTRALGDVLLEAGRALGADLPAGSFRDLLFSSWGGKPAVDSSLAQGGDFRPAPEGPVSLAASVSTLSFDAAPLSGSGGLTLVAYPSLAFYDGRSARIFRLQEIPDPVTKTVWGSYAEMSPATAASLGISGGDVVRIKTEAGEIELPAFPHDAVAEGVVAVAIGQGHQPIEPDFDLNTSWGQVDWLGRKRTHGVNVLAILPGRLDPQSGGLAWLSAKVEVEKTGATEYVVKTQYGFDQEHRGFVQGISLAALAGQEEGHDEAPHLEVKEYHPGEDSLDAAYRWGMSVDIDACTGCNACVAACSQENNVATIGEEMVAKGREMAWIRLERYVDHDHGEIEARQVPMMCQQCGAAPCENVCPVYATYHTQDGLNAMIYNRCIGTRYCSNNCPYKARRFNYLPYDFDYREPEPLGLNPDVTVRSKGVMEKCTFCVQRIVAAKDDARKQDRLVADGEITPACAQTCPSKAIVFGNLKDPESRVSKLRGDRRAYRILDHLYTRPAISYLKPVRRNGEHEA